MFGWYILLGMAGGIGAYHVMTLLHFVAAGIFTLKRFMWLAPFMDTFTVALIVTVPVMFVVSYRTIQGRDGFNHRTILVVGCIGVACFVALSVLSSVSFNVLYG